MLLSLFWQWNLAHSPDSRVEAQDGNLGNERLINKLQSDTLSNQSNVLTGINLLINECWSPYGIKISY